jgi:beta-lactamase family protein
VVAVLSVLLAALAIALLLGLAKPSRSAPRRTQSSAAANMATLSAGPRRFLRTGVQAIPDYNWYPGYYVLNNTDTAARKQLILDDPLVMPFTGVQFRYHWARSELRPGDYSAGFATLDADLERVAAKGKKIMVMLVYKEFDGTSAVPADLRKVPGPWCSGSYCGELTNGKGTSLAMLWNPTVEARLNAWIAAMALHLSQSPYIDSVAGILFNETALGTEDKSVLTSAGYDPYVYLQALKDNMLAATTAAPRLITILYFEGGFVSMDGNPVKAGEKMGDWMLLNPRTGAGTPDLKPKAPKQINHPCANPKYQNYIVCAPAVQAGDYSTAVTDSFDQSFNYATAPLPEGLHASFFTFSYRAGPGPNAFSFADVSQNLATHRIPSIVRPWPVTPVAGPTVKGDVALTRLLADRLGQVLAAGGVANQGRGGPDAVQFQYDVARDFQEALKLVRPVSAGCQRLLAAAEQLTAGEIAEAEGVDRRSPSRLVAAARKVAASEEQLRRLPRTCTAGEVMPAPAPSRELAEPRSAEAFPGVARAPVPAGTTAADVAINGRVVGRAKLSRGQAVYVARRGRLNLEFRFRAGKRLLSTAESRNSWSLPRSAVNHAAPGRIDRRLAAKLAQLARAFRGKAGIWVEDLTTGATAGWNESARLPAASTVKLAVLFAALAKFGPRPERSAVAYDLQTLTGWSSNLAANRLLRKLGGSESGGTQIAQAVLRRLGAGSSSYTGDYRVGTGVGGVHSTGSARVTTARDLGRILYLLQASAMNDPNARRITRLTEHEARVGLALLLSSEPSGDNVGLFRPSLGGTPIAQKNGWLRDARHTAAIMYPDAGPMIVVLLTYRPGITRPEAAATGAKLLKLVVKG